VDNCGRPAPNRTLDVWRRAVCRGVLATAAVVGMTTAWVPVTLAADNAAPNGRALVLLGPGADADGVAQAVELGGGTVMHVFPGAGLIGEIPDGVLHPDLRSVHRGPLEEGFVSALPAAAQTAARVWNGLLAAESVPDSDVRPEGMEAELVNDSFLAPAPRGLLAASTDPVPGFDETSEYMIGRVAVGVVLPESDGSLEPSTEDWSDQERSLVIGEIAAALDWWALREPRANLTFVYDDAAGASVSTGYEPINHGLADQRLWIGEVMTRMGYMNSWYYDQVRSYNNAMRDDLRTDWAFTVFVIDSSNDADNRFADGYFAYAYRGGPFCVITYGNDGYGPENMDAVVAHEVGHVFWALDQYASARQSCTKQSGYLGAENQNSEYGDCASDVPSIMRGQVAPFQSEAVDTYARGQIGWWDSDADGILDPVDTQLSVGEVLFEPDGDLPNAFRFTGAIHDEPHPSPLRRPTIINVVQGVSYRIDGGEWADAWPEDGNFDEYEESFTFETPSLATGQHVFEVAAVDSAGNYVAEQVAEVTVSDPIDEILDTTLFEVSQMATAGEPAPVVFAGTASSKGSLISTVYYRLDAEAWQTARADDGAFDEPEESFTLSIDVADLGGGLHQVQAYSIDGDGHVEPSPASASFSLPMRTYYFPVVRRSYRG
jgi:hypothetical protein